LTDHQQLLTETQALAWLHSQPDGTIATTVSDLARYWGWNRSTTSRRVKAWVASGQLVRTPSPDGRSIFTARTPDLAQACNAAANIASPSEKALVIPTVLPMQPAAQGEDLVNGAVHHFESSIARLSVTRAAGGAALASLALAVAWFGIRINAWYGGTLGRNSEASTLLSGLSVSADVLALILPTAARTLWTDRRRMAAAVAWALWTIMIAVALMATVGFAALNIADTTAARTKTVTELAALTARAERIRTERSGITESRSVAAIDAELQRAQPGAVAVWRATAGCRDVTLPASGEVCAPVLALRQAQATAERRDALDADLREAESQLRLLPAVIATDPQVDTAARLISWMSFGLITVTSNDIHLARIAGMTLVPQLAGLVLMLAVTIWQSRE
jgi:DNA-binding MarR family transcriptional regulator